MYYYWKDKIKFSKDFSSDEERVVYEIFKDAIGEKKGWKVEHNAIVRLINGRRQDIDIVIYRNESPYAVIEVKPDETYFKRAISQIVSRATLLYAPICIVCSPNKMIYFRKDEEPLKDKPEPVDLLLDNIRNILFEDENNKRDVTWEELRNKCIECIDAAKIEEDKKKELRAIFADSINILNEETIFYLDRKFEDEIFQSLLGVYKKNRLCRYTTVNSIFRTCNEQEHSMCCLVCMNDRSEINYAERNSNSSIDTDDINKCFILSCCDEGRKDDLTMFRLYADNAKGVCLEYTINKEMLEQNRFILAPVSYAINPKQNHPELDFIRKLQEINIHGKSFVLNRYSIWQHFFKPFEYRDEQEIRLFYYKRGEDEVGYKWIYENNFNIISPIVVFSIQEKENHFPLKLSKIILGPLAKEADINVGQLAQLIRDKNIDIEGNVDDLIAVSNITHFRG